MHAEISAKAKTKRVILQFVSCLFLSCIKRCYCKWKRKIIEKRQKKVFHNTNALIFLTEFRYSIMQIKKWVWRWKKEPFYSKETIFNVPYLLLNFTKMFESNRIQFLNCPKNVFLHAQTCYFERNLFLHTKMKRIMCVRVRIKS